jgi:preprotein translocase subunit SecD
MDRMISTLQTRINVYGLRECTFMPIWYEKNGFIEITMAGGTEEELKELLEHQGNFEAKIPIILNLDGNKSSLELDKKYDVFLENDRIKIGDISAGAGDNFTLAGIPFFVNNITDIVNLTSTVYSGNDIAIVYFGKSMVEKSGSGYSWSFPIEITGDGAKKFAWVTQNVPIAPARPGETYRYLESKIYLYLDNDLLDELNIRSGLKGKIETGISIEGGATTVDQAKNAMIKLQSILKSGALPTSINVVQLDNISPKLGAGFLGVIIMAAVAAILAVSAVIFIRYRRLKLIFPTILISLCEVLIILGAAALIKWNIDLAAIAGIIATVGTGVDSQIIMLDQALRGETKSWTLKERIGRAFFVIFGSGGTVLSAMLPLMILGFGLLRGFAIVTMIGVLAGILITRPAFGVIVEKLVRD